AVLGQDEPVGAQGMRAAGERAEVLRIRDAIEDDEERFRASGADQVVQLGVAELGKLGSDSLVCSTRRAAQKLTARSVLDADADLLRGPYDLLRALRPAAVLSALHQDPHDIVRVRPDRLENWVDAVDEPTHSTVTGTAT